MSIQKKSVIKGLNATKKANVAKGSPSFDASVTSGKKSPVQRFGGIIARADSKMKTSLGLKGAAKRLHPVKKVDG